MTCQNASSVSSNRGMRHAISILATLSFGLPAAQTDSPRRAEAEAIVASYVNAVGGAASNFGGHLTCHAWNVRQRTRVCRRRSSPG